MAPESISKKKDMPKNKAARDKDISVKGMSAEERRLNPMAGEESKGDGLTAE